MLAATRGDRWAAGFDLVILLMWFVSPGGGGQAHTVSSRAGRRGQCGAGGARLALQAQRGPRKAAAPVCFLIPTPRCFIYDPHCPVIGAKQCLEVLTTFLVLLSIPWIDSTPLSLSDSCIGGTALGTVGKLSKTNRATDAETFACRGGSAVWKPEPGSGEGSGSG
ncbi:unnamed protein product [Rangifer tarandus platyrhynchus]|uniref:Uncharacterized protein n=1 Tax=Rangifer tarandus platyrhynchus TaxID=3082113 RepID=A0AC59YF84_RANTA